MTTPFRRFAQAALSAAVGTLYTVDTGETAVIKGITLTNTTSAAVAVSVYVVPVAGAAGDANAFMRLLSVPADGVVDWTGMLNLFAGETLQAVGLGVTLTASGIVQ